MVNFPISSKTPKNKRTASEANFSPLSNSNDNSNSTTENPDLIDSLVDSQVNLVNTTLHSINELIPKLTTEQTPILQNLMTTITAQFDLLTKSINILKKQKQQQQQQPLYGQPPAAANQYAITAEELERQRSIVVSGLPESTKQLPSERMADDVVAVKHLLDTSDAIKQWKIKGKKMFQHLNIRPSLTLEQRNRRKHLIDECKKKRQENPDQDWIVYADTVILRSEVHIFRKQN
uniref:Uncharacterized protein n=1 Tax=Meloidogyne javanica TaxID=6303 RepID=A0A915LDX4_MELJA